MISSWGTHLHLSSVCQLPQSVDQLKVTTPGVAPARLPDAQPRFPRNIESTIGLNLTAEQPSSINDAAGTKRETPR